jgi:L-threonylcarbamoyladenylate synthase
MTQILRVDPTHPELEIIQIAASIIKSGGLVAFPTETVYGLGANGFDSSAVQRIFKAKNRPSSDPLILHLSSSADFSRVAVLDGLEGLVSKLARRFMPGALTLVLPKQKHVPLEVTAGGPTVAVRVPAHSVARALIAASNVPIAAPSANLFSRPSPTSASMVLEDLNGRIDAVLDGQGATIGLESTVLSLVGAPTLLRPGGVPLEDIEALIGEVLLPGEAVLEVTQAQPAPGMLLKHYSPSAKMCLLEHAPQKNLTQAIFEIVRVNHRDRIGLLLPSSLIAHFRDANVERFDLGETPTSISANLFKGLRALDRAGCSLIIAHQFESSGLGRALNDRLYRAAEGQVNKLDVTFGRVHKPLSGSR